MKGQTHKETNIARLQKTLDKRRMQLALQRNQAARTELQIDELEKALERLKA